ncbi:MAG: hypothetical protein EBX18_03075 [Actinobacteria bacterium]|nr:hypothetical protein [Actinomycetota bacterium]
MNRADTSNSSPTTTWLGAVNSEISHVAESLVTGAIDVVVLDSTETEVSVSGCDVVLETSTTEVVLDESTSDVVLETSTTEEEAARSAAFFADCQLVRASCADCATWKLEIIAGRKDFSSAYPAFKLRTTTIQF